MATPEELEALANTLAPPNAEIVRRAAKYLRQEDRGGLETAHNLLTDADTNIKTAGGSSPLLLLGYIMDLRQDRIELYGAVGRPADMTAPYSKRGW